MKIYDVYFQRIQTMHDCVEADSPQEAIDKMKQAIAELEAPPERVADTERDSNFYAIDEDNEFNADTDKPATGGK